MRSSAGLVLLLAATACARAAPPPAPVPVRVVVEARGVASAGQGERPRVRSVVAWRGGDACVGRYDRTEMSLQVTRVVQGEVKGLRNPSAGLLGLLDVQVIDDVAVFAQDHALQAPAGTWTLTLMPDGTPVVTSWADTPWRAGDPPAIGPVVEGLRRDLRAGDPQRAADALLRWAEQRCFGLVGDVLALADSAAPVVVAGGHVQLSNGESRPMSAQSTLGVEARRSLWRVTNVLRGEGSPVAEDSAERWRAWWAELLPR